MNLNTHRTRSVLGTHHIVHQLEYRALLLGKITSLSLTESGLSYVIMCHDAHPSTGWDAAGGLSKKLSEGKQCAI